MSMYIRTPSNANRRLRNEGRDSRGRFLRSRHDSVLLVCWTPRVSVKASELSPTSFLKGSVGACGSVPSLGVRGPELERRGSLPGLLGPPCWSPESLIKQWRRFGFVAVFGLDCFSADWIHRMSSVGPAAPQAILQLQLLPPVAPNVDGTQLMTRIIVL